jgi:TonB-dependent Receptor Plug Domain/CarboxypepD_reg-like domain
MKRNNFIFFLISVCLLSFAFSQTDAKDSDKLITISGKVMNSENKPVAGAILYVDDLKTTISTKKNGSYKIKVSSSSISIEVRSAEYGTSKKAINGQTEIDFILSGSNEQDLKSEGTNKVTLAQDSIKKTSKIRGKKLNTYSDIYQMIRAEVTGVVVNGRSVQIQQGHSFFGSTTPLFVINGVIVSSIDDVNPRDVKSIRILKGTEASVYGINGTNGVISITLKNGSEKEQ